MNKFTKRKALESDQDFILNLQKKRLSHYRLHEKLLPSSKDNPEYRPLEIHEVDIIPVFIIMLGKKQVGAYKFEYDKLGNFYRLFWLAAIEDVKGVGSFVMDEIKLFAKQQGCRFIKLSVNLSNISAIKCYVNKNFEFEKEYDQEVEMKVTI